LIAIFIAIAGGAYVVYSVPRNSGTITVSGAFALYPLMVEWADEYQAIQRGIKIEVSAGGAGKGMTDALSGLVDLGMVSREIYPEEVAKGAVWVAVAIDAVVVTVSDDNPVIEDLMARGVTPSLLRKVFITGEITTWGQIVNRSDITDVIDLYTRSDACGAAATFAEYLGYYQEDLLGVGVFGDPGLAEAVKRDSLSLGYNNVNYAYDIITGNPVDGVRVVPLDINEDGVISQDEDFYSDRDTMIEAIASGLYPSPPSRSLNLVTKDKFKGIVLDFVRWILTDGQESAVTAGYVPISPERRAQELAKLGR
jgi:phosphate transport system substrate-binding protein